MIDLAKISPLPEMPPFKPACQLKMEKGIHNPEEDLIRVTPDIPVDYDNDFSPIPYMYSMSIVSFEHELARRR